MIVLSYFDDTALFLFFLLPLNALPICYFAWKQYHDRPTDRIFVGRILLPCMTLLLCVLGIATLFSSEISLLFYYGIGGGETLVLFISFYEIGSSLWREHQHV